MIVQQEASGYIEHDAGFSAMRLTNAGDSLSKGVTQRLLEFAQRYRAQFVDGRVTAKATPEDVAQVVCLVANAARSIADYIYEIRRQAEGDFRIVVFDKLRDIIGDRVRAEGRR